MMETIKVMSLGQKSRFLMLGPCSSAGRSWVLFWEGSHWKTSIKCKCKEKAGKCRSPCKLQAHLWTLSSKELKIIDDCWQLVWSNAKHSNTPNHIADWWPQTQLIPLCYLPHQGPARLQEICWDIICPKHIPNICPLGTWLVTCCVCITTERPAELSHTGEEFVSRGTS